MYAKNVVDLLIGTIIAAAWGYQMSFSVWPNGYEGWTRARVEAGEWDAGDEAESWGAGWHGFLFHCLFQANSATIVSGAMAERTELRAYTCIAILTCGVIYPLGSLLIQTYPITL